MTDKSELYRFFPETWGRGRFGTLFTESREINGASPAEQALSVSEYHGVTKRNDSRGQIESADVSSYRVVRPGQLAANVMWLNRTGLGVSNSTGYVSPAYRVFDISEHLHPAFVNYLIRSNLYRAEFEKLGRGVRPNAQMVDSSDLRAMFFPEPPLATQRRIANFLDRETAQIDTLIAEQKHLIDLLDERRRAVIDSMISSMDRPWVALRRVIEKIDQGVSPQAESGLATEAGSWGVLKSGCVNRGLFRPEEHKLLPPEFEINSRDVVHEGDLLVSRASGSPDLVGSCGLVTELEYQLILSDKLFRLSTRHERVDPSYLYWTLNSRLYRDQVRGAISGAQGLANNLPLAALRSFKVPLPDLQAQQQISNALTSQTQQIDLLRVEAERLIELARERRSALITAAVTGQIEIPEAS